MDGTRRARQGETGASNSFEGLIQRYQDMAFGYALSLLRDYHLAQDATQEALFIAYMNLPTLRERAAFPGWLRGIVHHQCCRYLRKRRFDTIPLDDAIGVPGAAIGPAQYLERREALDHILAAIGALPDAQREVAVLYYIKDYAQREIAAFLDVPVSTVNNRLHAARQQLRGELRPMTEHTTTTTTAASPTPPVRPVGQIVRVQGPIVDARFADGALPGLMGRATITDEASGRAWAAQVVQHLDDRTIRCIVTDDAEGIAPGLAVRDAGGAVHAPIDAALLERALPLLGNQRDTAMGAEARTEPRTVLETGIKVIDLMCPYVVGGKAGMAGGPGTGKLVVMAELLHALARRNDNLSLFALLSVKETSLVYMGEEEVPHPTGMLQALYVSTAHPTDPTDPASLVASGLLDAMTYTSYALGILGIWPAVDPLLSWSRHLDPAVVGQEHYDVALGVRWLLRRYRDLQEGLDGAAGAALSSEDKTVIARARRVQRFFTQPFSVAEPFTQRKGQYMSRAETVRGFKALLEGAYDSLPEDAFLWCGPIEQAVEHAKTPRA